MSDTTMNLPTEWMTAIIKQTIPKYLNTSYSVDGVKLRSYGQKANDLNIEFSRKPKNELTTDILQLCASSSDGSQLSIDFLCDLPLGVRYEGILKIALLSLGGFIDLALKCSNIDCNQRLEIKLTLEDIQHVVTNAEPTDNITFERANHIYTFRKPTGRDQIEWAQKLRNKESSQVNLVLKFLLIDESDKILENELVELAESLIDLGQLFQDADPLINLIIPVSCPSCSVVTSHSLDSESIAIDCLQSIHRNLVESIHILATHYHWTESEILSLPYWRRNLYLSMIGGDR